MRLALFVTCLNDTLFPDTGRAVVRVLERLGHEVTFPEAQTCCGQLHFNTGYQSESVPLVRGFVDAFAGTDAVVAPSASCVAMVRDFHRRVATVSGDRGLADLAGLLLVFRWVVGWCWDLEHRDDLVALDADLGYQGLDDRFPLGGCAFGDHTGELVADVVDRRW